MCLNNLPEAAQHSSPWPRCKPFAGAHPAAAALGVAAAGLRCAGDADRAPAARQRLGRAGVCGRLGRLRRVVHRVQQVSGCYVGIA